MEQLRGRFCDLADGDGSVPGAEELASGLEKIAAHLGEDDDADRERLAVIVRGLSGLADFLEPGDVEAEFSSTDEEDSDTQGLDQFLATFKKEAGKRIQGLSISMMGIFGDESSAEALEQSADHLHAIRGSAAMLGIDDIAGLAAEMEDTLLRGAKLPPEQRDWPTKTLLRGYALLEEGLERDPPSLPANATDEVIERLHQSAPPSPSRAEDVSRETANTDDDSELGEDSELDGEQSPQEVEQPILIVDDVDTIAASVGFILSELGVPIEVASNGEEAMKLLQDMPFSLVISDVDMPRMDGIALTRMIRSTESLSSMPVILLTSLDHPEERQAGMEAGATDYIIKGSIGGGELQRRVRDLLEVAPVVAKSKMRKRRILVAEDTETVAASIAFVLSEGPFEIVLTSNGRDALKRLEAEDFDLLITDMQMPYMDGTQLVSSVRADADLAELPVVMLTSVEDDEMIDEAIDAGIDRYLLKGEVAGGKLLSIVDELLS